MVAAKKTTKKATAKKPVAKKTRAAASKKPSHPDWKTGKLGPEARPFLSFSVTSQTVIWAIFMIFVLILQLVIIFKELDIVNSLS